MKLSLVLIAAIFGQITISAYVSADEDPTIEYNLTASMSGAKLRLQHRIVNHSPNSICFFPENADIAAARFFAKSGKELENIGNSGFVTSHQSIDIAYPDGVPHTFESSDNMLSILKSQADVASLSTVKFEFYAYDCRSLISGMRQTSSPVVHRVVTATIVREK